MINRTTALIPLALVTLLFTGCMSGNTKPDSTAQTQQASYARYQTDRPEPRNHAIGMTSVDKITGGIAGIYGTTIDLTDKTITQIENSEVAAKLDKVLAEQGHEAWESAVNTLVDTDKEQYETYLRNQVSTLAVVDSYLKDALELLEGIAQVNVTSLVSNPLKIASSVKSVNLARSQIDFSIEALRWMKKHRDLYQTALTTASR